VRDDQVISGKFRHLKSVPDIAGTGSLAEKEQGRATAVDFVVDFDLVASTGGHVGSRN
jgi:hypothetical protein